MRPLALMMTLISIPVLAAGCGDDSAEGGAKDDGAADDGSGVDGADGVDGGGDGTADGTDGADGGGEGGADGGSDGTADGADGTDGGADGADGGGDPTLGLLFSDDFEAPSIGDAAFTGGGASCDNWVLTPFSYSGYDPYIGDFSFWVDGGLMQDRGGEFTSSDPLPAPAGGVQAMYLTGYASRSDGSIGGHFDLRSDLVTVAAERSYRLDIAVGQRAPYPYGEARVYLYSPLGSEDYVSVESAMYISDLPDGGFESFSLELDPPDRFAGAPLQVRVLLYQAGLGGYTTVVVDNVSITAIEAPPN